MMMQPSWTMILIAIRYSTSFIISINHEETLKPSSLPSDLNNLFILQGKIEKSQTIVWGSTQLCVAVRVFIHVQQYLISRKNSVNFDENSRLLVQLHWSIQNSSCTLDVPMFLCNFRGRVVLTVLKLGGLRSPFTGTAVSHAHASFRRKLQIFFSDYALIVKSEIRIANPNPDFLCMCCTCSARAI